MFLQLVCRTSYTTSKLRTSTTDNGLFCCQSLIKNGDNLHQTSQNLLFHPQNITQRLSMTLTEHVFLCTLVFDATWSSFSRRAGYDGRSIALCLRNMRYSPSAFLVVTECSSTALFHCKMNKICMKKRLLKLLCASTELYLIAKV